jgi:two-component sensor histidine kinase
LGAYLGEVCKGLVEAGPRCEIHVDTAKHLFILSERAVLVALIVNELITNACKYAYGGKERLGSDWT